MQSVCCNKWLLDDDSSSSRNDNSNAKFVRKRQKDNSTIIYDLWDTDRPARELQGTDFEEFIFQKRMMDIIDEHASKNNETQQPLFLMYAPHVAHCPLQVPEEYLEQFDFMDNDESMCQAYTSTITGPDDKPKKYSCRKQYHAMVKVLDDILGNLVDRLKHHGMYENLLIVVTSDNGGPVNPEESAATNFPLRGGKYSDWEGGVRSVAFLSGGYIPSHRRGQVVQEPIHIADWYATLPALAGIDVHHEESKSISDDKRVPPVDAVNVWSLISGEEGHLSDTPPRHEIPLSDQALIVGSYKLIWKKNVTISGWTYPDYPNAKTAGKDEMYGQTLDCSSGCLFNVDSDPSERHDLALSEPDRLQSMKERLIQLRKGFFENDEKGIDSCPPGFNDDDKDLLCSCWMAVNYYGGFFGPYQEVDMEANVDINQLSSSIV